jgi:hypothetical protein
MNEYNLIESIKSSSTYIFKNVLPWVPGLGIIVIGIQDDLGLDTIIGNSEEIKPEMAAKFGLYQTLSIVGCVGVWMQYLSQ